MDETVSCSHIGCSAKYTKTSKEIYRHEKTCSYPPPPPPPKRRTRDPEYTVEKEGRKMTVTCTECRRKYSSLRAFYRHKKQINGCKEKKKKHLRYTENQSIFCQITFSIFGDKILSDNDLLSWYSYKLNRKSMMLKTLLEDHQSGGILELRGRRRYPLEVRQKVFDLYHNNSIITVDRRNGRDYSTMSLDAYRKFPYYVLKPSSVDVEIEIYSTKRNNQRMVRSIRRVSTLSTRSMLKSLSEVNLGNLSIGFVHSLKPFYIVNPTEREK